MTEPEPGPIQGFRPLPFPAFPPETLEPPGSQADAPLQAASYADEFLAGLGRQRLAAVNGHRG